jgi:hypothetical protein
MRNAVRICFREVAICLVTRIKGRSLYDRAAAYHQRNRNKKKKVFL